MRMGKPTGHGKAQSPTQGVTFGGGRLAPPSRPEPRRPIPADPQPPVGHRILSGDAHLDAVEALCVTGDLIFGNATPLWDRLPIGNAGELLKVSGGMPTWSADTHALLSSRHSDTTAAAVARGALITGQGSTPAWARLAVGSSGTVLRSDGTDIAWSADAHNLLSARHGDTTTASATRGDIITAQGASPTWSRLAKSGTSTHVLKAGASEPAWGQVAFSELSGTITDAQHGALTTSSSHAMAGDVSGTTAAAVVDKVKGKAVAAPVNPTNNGQYLQFDGTSYVWATPSAGVGTHNLLSATHPDTTAASPTRGDIVTAQGASPTWSRLAKGSANTVLKMGANEPAWGSVAFSELTFSGLTAGQVLKASGTTAAAFADLTPSDVVFAGLTAGHVWKATGAAAASFGQLLHSQLGSIGANDHHNQAHTLFSTADHSDVTGTPASGDLIYRNGSSQWTRLAKGSDDQILKLASGLPTWAAVNSLATARALIQGWKRDDIRNAGGSAGEMNGFDGLATGETMAYSGTIVGIAVALEKDIDNAGAAGSASYTLTAYKSSDQGATWSATAVTVTLSAGSGTQRRASATGFSVSFAAGDMLTIYDQKASLPAVTNGSKANLIVVFN